MNDWDVPELDPALCAARLVPPVTKWGTRRRTDPMPGTWHAYCNDFHFTHLLKRPEMLPATGCVAAVELNLSVCDETPAAEALWHTYQKRRVVRIWQQMGVAIIVDLNVGPRHAALNLLGVPRGWTAYATRAHREYGFDAIHDEYLRAVDHAGTEAILFCVFGGGRRRIGNLCKANGWRWVPEHRQVVAGLERPYGEGC
jgi:hypothetical protein